MQKVATVTSFFVYTPPLLKKIISDEKIVKQSKKSILQNNIYR